MFNRCTLSLVTLFCLPTALMGNESYCNIPAPVYINHNTSEAQRRSTSSSASYINNFVSAQDEHLRNIRNGTVDEKELLNGLDPKLVQLGTHIANGARWLKQRFTRKKTLDAPQEPTTPEVDQFTTKLTSHITKTFDNQRNLLVEYEQSYIDTVYEDSVEYSPSDQRMVKRIQSLQASLRDPHNFQEKRYELKEETKTLLYEYIPDALDYMQQVYGNELQQTLHQECIALFDTAAEHKVMFDQQGFTQAFVYSTDAGQSYNRYGYTIEAMEHIDFCWQLWHIALGCGDGVILTATRVAHAVAHPIDTVVGVAEDVYAAAYLLRRITKRIEAISYEQLFNTGHVSPTYNRTCAQIQQLCDALAQKYHASSARDIARELTAAGLEMFLLHKGSQAVGALCREAIDQARHISNALKTVSNTPYTFVNPDGRILCNVMAMVEGDTCGLRYPTAYCNPLWPGVTGGIVKNFNNLEIIINGIKVWIDEKTLQHIFKGEIYQNGKFGGLHHDPGGFLRKEGRLRNIRELSGGYYTADFYDGVKWRKNKTFFPETMPQEEIMKAIEKTLSYNTATIKVQDDGRRVIQTHLLENVYIKIVLDSDGRLVSAYPFEHIP